MSARILVVDDDAAVRLTVEHVLSSAGYRIASAANGKQALSLVKKFDPDVVLTDLIMPEMDGVETIAKIREVRRDQKIIAMSGGARIGNSNILQRAREIGADRIIPKPFDFAELKSLIEQCLRAS